MAHWIFSCRKISAMISQDMDKKLSITKRLGVRLHLMMCVFCRRYQQQLQFIRSLITEQDDNRKPSKERLSREAKKRIIKKLKDEARNRPKRP